MKAGSHVYTAVFEPKAKSNRAAQQRSFATSKSKRQTREKRGGGKSSPRIKMDGQPAKEAFSRYENVLNDPHGDKPTYTPMAVRNCNVKSI